MAESVFEAVKQSITVREAAQMYGIEVNRSGMACCPFHDDKNPSMKLNEEYFYCFGCGATGDVIDFTARLYNLSPKEAAEKLAQDFGLAYDSQAPPRRRHVRQKSEAQKFKEDRDHAFRVLADYFHLLRKWETDYTPKTPEENPHPRFMEAIQKKDYVGYLLDFFLENSPEEQKLWIAEHQSEIAKLERRVKFMADKTTNRERLQEITAGIEQGIKELFESEKYMRYLSVMSKFHRYSVNNTMLIYMQRPDATLVAGSDYVATHAEDGTVTITILSEAAKEAETLKVASTSLKPDGVTAADIVGGVDALTGKETGLELVRQIYPRFGMTPGILLAPGWSHNPTVAAALQAKTEGINGNFDCVTYLDISTDPEEDGAEVYTDVKTAKEALGATSPHAAALWPMGAVGDKVYYLSAMFAALTAYTDAGNSDVPYESPSNKDLKITKTVLKDGTEVLLDQQQANDLLNANGVITAINANGYKAWGNNTAAYPSTTDPKDRWLAVRRFFDWDGNNFILTYFQKVDKPGNTRLIQSIVDSQNIIGNGYVARDYCAGYRTEFKSDENPITNLLDGHLTVHTYLAPYIPAEYIENIREYDTEALEAALTGGGE